MLRLSNDLNHKNVTVKYTNIMQQKINKSLKQSNQTDSLKYAHTHARAHTHSHFAALLDFVWDYPGEPAPEK